MWRRTLLWTPNPSLAGAHLSRYRSPTACLHASAAGLVRPGEGTLRHTHETARAVRRRLHLSPRQYKKRLKAAKRSGLSRYLQPFLRREVAPPVVTRQPVKRRGR